MRCPKTNFKREGHRFLVNAGQGMELAGSLCYGLITPSLSMEMAVRDSLFSK